MYLCSSCDGPIPGASRRCPWCHAETSETPHRPEHLYATFEGQAPRARLAPPPDARLAESDWPTPLAARTAR